VTRDDERFYLERGMGGTLGYGEQPAVIVIDFARAFTNPARALGGDLAAELRNARALLDAARVAGCPVYFTTVAYEEEDVGDAGVWSRKISALSDLRAGSPDVEIDPALGRRPDEPVLVKKYASAFFGTDLLSRLTARRVDTLIIAGCTTSGCVRATAVDAIQHGLRPIVVLEAVGDRSPAAHAQSIVDLRAKYADVVSLDDAVEHLGRMRPPVAGDAGHGVPAAGTG